MSLCGIKIIIKAPPVTIPANRMTAPKKIIRRRCRVQIASIFTGSDFSIWLITSPTKRLAKAQ